MNFVLFHLGTRLPDHIKYCIRQIEYTNPNSKIYLITNVNTTYPNVEIVDVRKLSIPDLKSYYLYHPMGQLFRTAMLRIFFLESFLTQYDIEHIIHFDNDVLIYENVDNMVDRLSKYAFLITPSFETEYVFGFSYIRNTKTLKDINKHLLELVIQGEHVLEPMVGTMPHEMRLLHYVNEQNGMSLISDLPTLPPGIINNDYDTFNMCFDPSSYGQYLGGLAPERQHYIGRTMIDKGLTVVLDKTPRAILNGVEYKICNLHIHNKKLGEFISCK